MCLSKLYKAWKRKELSLLWGPTSLPSAKSLFPLLITRKLPHTLGHFFILWTALLPFLKWLFPENTTPRSPLDVSAHSLLFHTHPIWLQAYHEGWLRNVPTGRINKYSALLTTALYSRMDGCMEQCWQSYLPLPLTHVCLEREHLFLVSLSIMIPWTKTKVGQVMTGIAGTWAAYAGQSVSPAPTSSQGQ